MTVSYFEIFCAFLRASAVGFGGGAALAPAIYREAVAKKKWVNDTQFGDILAVSNILPGPSAVEMAAAVGWELRGLPGALAAVAGLTLPFSILMIAGMMFIFDRLGTHPEEKAWFNRATMGLFIFVAAMSLQMALKLFRDFLKELDWVRASLISLFVFLLIDDNFWYGSQLPLRINNAFVIIVMIYAVVLREASWGRGLKFGAFIPGILFLWSLSALFPGWVHYGWVTAFSLCTMGVIGFWAFRSSPAEEVKHEHPALSLSLWRRILTGQLKLWTVFLGFWGISALVFAPLRAWLFVKLALVTVMTSLLTFGGGPVYIPLAIGAMAGPNAAVYLYTKERMMELVAIQNIMPSPIMTKLSAASGYDMVRDLCFNIFPDNGVSSVCAGTFAPETAAVFGSLILILVMTLPAVTAMLLAWPSIDAVKASPSLKDTARWIKPILVAVFVSVGVMFAESALDILTESAENFGIGLSGSWAWGHLAGLGILSFWVLSSRIIPDWLFIPAALLWGLFLC